MAGGPGGSGAGVESNSLVWAFIMSTFAAIGGILLGYDAVNIGGIIVMQDWLQLFGKYDSSSSGLGWYLPTNDQSLVVSILSAGTFCGSLLASPMGDVVGRKWGIIASCAVFCLGVGLQLDTHWVTFVIGRVIAGLGIGLVSCLVPMYQSECSPKNIRGTVLGVYQLFFTFGALLVAIVLNATKAWPNHSSWRTPIAIQFAWAAILSGGMVYLPESPRFLVMKGRTEAAKAALGRLLTKPKDSLEVEAEYVEINSALEVDRAIGGGSYIDCFRNTDNKRGLRTLTGLLLQPCQLLTGISFVYIYGTTFFKSAGISNPFTITIICNVVTSTMSLVGLPLIDRVGRRRLLLIGAVGMCLSQFIVAIVGVTAGDIQADHSVNLPAQRVLITFVSIYLAFYATTWGPVGWVVTAEIFPLEIRAKGMSLCIAHSYLWNFGISYATPYLINPSVNGVKTANLGVKVFFIWGSCCLGCLVFAYFFVPEMKGLSLEQIDLLYRRSSVVNSEKCRQKILAEDAKFTEKVGSIDEV